MTKQGWTAATSAAIFVVLLILVSVIPVPFVIRGPGTVVDLLRTKEGQPAILVQGLETYPDSAGIGMTTVSLTKREARVTLTQAFAAYLRRDYQLSRRDVVYPVANFSGQEQVHTNELPPTIAVDATVAALRLADIDVRPLPIVTQVSGSGPAYGKLEPGDLITAINSVAVESRSDVDQIISAVEPGTVINVTFLRGDQRHTTAITSVASQDNPRTSRIGIEMENSYQHDTQINTLIDESLITESGALAYSLALYDVLTPGDLTGEYRVAATGIVAASGEVSGVSSVSQRVRAAELDGADVMLIPATHCSDLAYEPTRMRVVPVSSVLGAVNALEYVKDPQSEQLVPQC